MIIDDIRAHHKNVYCMFLWTTFLIWFVVFCVLTGFSESKRNFELINSKLDYLIKHQQALEITLTDIQKEHNELLIELCNAINYGECKRIK